MDHSLQLVLLNFFSCIRASGKAGPEAILVISFSLLVTSVAWVQETFLAPALKRRSLLGFSFKIDVKNLPFGLGQECMALVRGAATVPF